MTPQDKAKELYDKYLPFVQRWDDFNAVSIKKENAKQCALVAISFAKSSLDWHLYPLDKEWVELNQIKEEIEKL